MIVVNKSSELLSGPMDHQPSSHNRTVTRGEQWCRHHAKRSAHTTLSTTGSPSLKEKEKMLGQVKEPAQGCHWIQARGV